MNNITIKQLRYFLTVAKTEHFGMAAAICAISQPAISIQIRELEEELKAPLFERNKRRVFLTSFGHEFVTEAKKIVEQVDHLSHMAQASQKELNGILKLGIIPTIAPYFLPTLINRLRIDFPNVQPRIHEGVTAQLETRLINSELDAIILALPHENQDLEGETIFKEDFVLLRAKSEANEPVPSMSTLGSMPWLLLEEGHCLRDQTLQYCSFRKSVPKNIQDAHSLSTLVQMVGAGLGVTLIPEMAIDVETHSANVSVSRFPKPAPSRQVGILWRKSTPLKLHLKMIARCLKDSTVQPS